ncbi:hypothetical protein [Arcticibacter sp.]|jgi:hypothetical protein|uniref:hypothetical protein n=1 Tax=Arcticibacter sp. TaxID=1872630 RepID=UPI003890F7A7
MLESRKIILAIAFVSLSCVNACSKGDPKDQPTVPAVSVEKYELVNKKEVFGFHNQSRYSYCPSLVKEPDGTVHMYFCGNPEQLIMVDNIYHVRINPDGSQTPPKSVVQPGMAGSWDDHHICDPSVLGGRFQMNGNSYKYAMFYLVNQYGVYYNEIGLAFSNDLEASQWTKYPGKLITKTWNNEGDEVLPNGSKSWGVGQPSAFSLDQRGKVLLTFTVGDRSGTRIEWLELDLSNMDDYKPMSSVKMPDEGLFDIGYKSNDYTCNSDFAVDIENDKIIMVRPVQPHPAVYPAFLNTSLEVDFMSLSDFRSRSGKWESMLRIVPYMTGYKRNHNAGLERNQFGGIDNWEEPVIYYTISKEAPEVSPSGQFHAEWSYRIWRGQLQKKR